MRCSSARAIACCCSSRAASATRCEIGYQARPKIFARHIIKPEMLYESVAEVDERVRADGTVERALDLDGVRAELEAREADGHRRRRHRADACLSLSGA